MSVLDNWQQWKEFLGERLEQGQAEGMDRHTIEEVAYQVGEYLSNEVKPKNEQEQVLSDMWHVASEEEQHAIANMMVKLVQR